MLLTTGRCCHWFRFCRCANKSAIRDQRFRCAPRAGGRRKAVSAQNRWSADQVQTENPQRALDELQRLEICMQTYFSRIHGRYNGFVSPKFKENIFSYVFKVQRGIYKGFYYCRSNGEPVGATWHILTGHWLIRFDIAALNKGWLGRNVSCLDVFLRNGLRHCTPAFAVYCVKNTMATFSKARYAVPEAHINKTCHDRSYDCTYATMLRIVAEHIQPTL